jgi:WD40 repeat protein
MNKLRGHLRWWWNRCLEVHVFSSSTYWWSRWMMDGVPFLSTSCRVVSGSRDATLRVWDIENGHCLHTLMGHVAAVRCVQYDGRRIVSGAYDYTVRVWDPDTETCLHTLQGHSNRVYSLQVTNKGTNRWKSFVYIIMWCVVNKCVISVDIFLDLLALYLNVLLPLLTNFLVEWINCSEFRVQSSTSINNNYKI